MAILDLTKQRIWKRCFKCRAKLESAKERKCGFCRECLAEMGVDLTVERR